MTGAELIARERQRQIEEEGFTDATDAVHRHNELVLAAICYATPMPLWVQTNLPEQGISFVDPWPAQWPKEWDKRRASPKKEVRLPDQLTLSEQMDLLVKAGALIAAEIDRRERDYESYKALVGGR